MRHGVRLTMSPLRLVQLFALFACAAAIEPRPALAGRRIGLTARPQLLAADAGRYWSEPWRQHDAFNLVALPPIVALTIADLLSASPRFARPLALALFGYIAADSAWILARPSVVRAPRTLLGHHILVLLMLLHPLTHAPHARYTAWMSIVELNTILLILRRHVRSSEGSVLVALIARAVDACFTASWLAIRVAWFPYLPLHWWCFIAEPWPAGPRGAVTRVAMASAALALALMQLAWTRNALRARRQRERGSAAGWL